MVVPVKSLVALLDRELGYVADAKAHHECSEDEYNAYMEHMEKRSMAQLTELRRISSNKVLISKYEILVANTYGT